MAEHDDGDYIPLPETPEWKTAKAARGKPRGHHIRQNANPEAGEYSREELFETLAAYERQKEESMVLSGIRFDKSISIGAVAGIFMTVLSWGAAYGVFTRWQATIEARIDANALAIADNRKGDEDRSKRYIPQIEAMQRVTDSVGDRFLATSQGLNQMRDTVTDLAKAVAQTHEEIMVLGARLGYDKRTELKSTVPPH